MIVARRRWSRAGSGLLAVLALAVLVGCRKPLPTITVYGSGHSIIVDAAAYRFAGGPNHQRISDYGQAPTITVEAGSPLLIDVPREVATNAWIVAAFTLDSAGTSKPLAGAGSAGALRDRHSTRVSTSPAGVGTYYLQVVELRGTEQAGGWVVHVRTTS